MVAEAWKMPISLAKFCLRGPKLTQGLRVNSLTLAKFGFADGKIIIGYLIFFGLMVADGSR